MSARIRAVDECLSRRPITLTASLVIAAGLSYLFTGAQVLAETGDDRPRFDDAKDLKAYVGAGEA